MRLPFMAIVFLQRGIVTKYCESDDVLVAVKRYRDGKQFGSIRKLKNDTTGEDLQRAEDSCLLDCLHWRESWY